MTIKYNNIDQSTFTEKQSFIILIVLYDYCIVLVIVYELKLQNYLVVYLFIYLNNIYVKNCVLCAYYYLN